MLKQLRIRNFAIIDNLELEFSGGLNALTGETGAGKSIIIGALGILLGQRAYAEMIRSGQDSAIVEAVFDVRLNNAPSGIDASKGITIKREVQRGGRTKAFVNNEPVTIQTLAEIGNSIVDIHGQHDHQSLLSPDNQLEILDAFGGHGALRDKAASSYSLLSSLRTRLDRLRSSARERQQRIDLLTFQVQEIDDAALSPGEDASLEQECEILSNMTRLKELVEEAYETLSQREGSAIEGLGASVAALRELAAIDADGADALKSLNDALAIAEDAALTIRDMRDKYEPDPRRLDAVVERIELIKRLKRKYGETIEAILTLRDSAATELSDMETAEETSAELEKKIAQAAEAFEAAAAALTAARRETAARLEKSVIKTLKELAFKDAVFKVAIEPSEPSPTGADALEFMLSANPGELAKPLQKVASGGELSRIMLALKSVMGAVDRIPVLVFDEVDAGIGGKTAQSVAAKLKDISKGHQVLCITHLPQIASLAGEHFLIDKQSTKDTTRVKVIRLDSDGREQEIARMLSGSVTPTSLKHARELMGQT